MEVVITSFINPFSFYCVPKSETIETVCVNDNAVDSKLNKTKLEVTDLHHGQYIAVLWKNKWTRGVVSREEQLLIWLIDHGFFIRLTNDTIYTDLPLEYKKYPSKVFEASLHGVTPVDKIFTPDIRINNVFTTVWNKGANKEAHQLINNAKKVLFFPVASLSTRDNAVILGDLYLETHDKQLKNLVDELEKWPMFLNKDADIYIKNISDFYNNRNKHSACLLKPDIAFKIPVMTLQTSLEEYVAICAKMSELTKQQECENNSVDGSTVLNMQYNYKKEKQSKKLTSEDINYYANMYISLHGEKRNVLNILINKCRDLNVCKRYKDHDLKSIGCCISVRNPKRKYFLN